MQRTDLVYKGCLRHGDLSSGGILNVAGPAEITVADTPLPKFKTLLELLKGLLIARPGAARHTVVNMYAKDTGQLRTLTHKIQTLVKT